MKNSSDTIGNRIRDLPACSAVPQPTAPMRVPVKDMRSEKFYIDAPSEVAVISKARKTPHNKSNKPHNVMF